MKYFLPLILILLLGIYSCKKNNTNTTNNANTPTADQYVGNWHMHDSLENTGNISEKDFTIQKVSDDKILILDFPYSHDSIYMNTKPTVSTDTDNLKFPIYHVGFISFTSTRFDYLFEVFTPADYYEHTGYALKK